MATITKTIRQPLGYRSMHAPWFEATKMLFNQIAAFYFDVIVAHVGILELDSKTALNVLEQLTHTTKDNPNPIMPLSTIADNIPARFRRAAIRAALGSARSFYTQLDKWHKRKEKAQAKGKKLTIRPPVPPRTWNKSPVLYAGQWKDRTSSSIMLKFWTGRSWVWVRVHLSGRQIPDGWEPGSPSLVLHGAQWWLHTPIERQITSPGKVEKQVTSNSNVKICAVDLNISEHLAVCTIQTIEGTVLATRFIRGGKQVHGFRKRLLGKIARRRNDTGVIALGEQDNVLLWTKVRRLNKQVAHWVSSRIVEFARKYDAPILVFEYLSSLRPEKGKYSKRTNSKRMYWLKGSIFVYAKYKAWDDGIVTCRVNPKNTSRECARCHALLARYNVDQPEKGYMVGASLVYCARCGMRGNADRNASIVIGQRLVSRYLRFSQEKPRASLLAERSAKAEGVVCSQDVECAGRLSTNHTRHGAGDEHGTAQDVLLGMAGDILGIPHQLRLFNE